MNSLSELFYRNWIKELYLNTKLISLILMYLHQR
eukprot:UN06473